MSFPSVEKHLEAGKNNQDALLAAVTEDCPLAIEYLRQRAREANELGEPIQWVENPNSDLGKQLIRIHASDAVRPLVQNNICGGLNLTFVNCCGGIVGGEKKNQLELISLQIDFQAGPTAYAGC